MNFGKSLVITQNNLFENLEDLINDLIKRNCPYYFKKMSIFHHPNSTEEPLKCIP